ncbi:helix-turn-helix domain-containing protein [Shinella sp. BYT-45]|uniref:helix-turn-helix domain-containing protein n=1 Tax=Shinella sp. BYT-45 TaxID=3377377 RepID=UPI00397F2DAD
MFEQIGTVLERVLDKQRARAPVRRNSYRCGRCEAVFWKRTSRQEVRRILLAAKRYELALRRRSRRCGPLGSVAIEVLEYFVNLVDFRTGRLEPSLDTLVRRLKRSRDAIVRALKNLRAHGFLDWLRRYVPTGQEGRGPQVRQASNAYRLHLPERVKQLLGWRGLPPSLPDDCKHAQEVRQAELETYDKSLSLEELALSTLGDTPLGQSLARLGKNIEQRKPNQQRESARRVESESYSIKPAPD